MTSPVHSPAAGIGSYLLAVGAHDIAVLAFTSKPLVPQMELVFDSIAAPTDNVSVVPHVTPADGVTVFDQVSVEHPSPFASNMQVVDQISFMLTRRTTDTQPVSDNVVTNVTNNPVTISGTIPTSATAGAAYTASATAAGGYPPYSYSVVNLPPWATASGSGFGGTPPTAQTDSGVAIVVTDNVGQTATLGPATIVVDAAPAVSMVPSIVHASNIPIGDSQLNYVGTATAGATDGALVAIFQWQGAGSVTSFTDSTGAAWTQVMQTDDHSALAIFKRLVGSHPIVAGVTTFDVLTAFVPNMIMLYVISVPFATGITTSADVGNMMTGNASGNIGFCSGDVAIQIPSPSSAASYQVGGFATWHGTTASFVGGDASWVTLDTMADYANSGGLAIGYRKGGSIGPTNITANSTGGTFGIFGWCELTAPAGGATPIS